MLSKQKFESNIYMKLFQWAYVLLAGSICFSIVNIPFFFASIGLALDIQNIPWFMLSLLFFGPGLLGMFGMLDVFRTERNIGPIKEFFRSYFFNWKKGLIYGCILVFGLIVALLDSAFFARLAFGQWLIPFFILLAILCIAFSINCLYFQVRNPNSTVKDVFRISIYYSLKKIHISVINTVLFVLVILMMILKPQFGFVITPSLFLGLIFLNGSRLCSE